MFMLDYNLFQRSHHCDLMPGKRALILLSVFHLNTHTSSLFCKFMKPTGHAEIIRFRKRIQSFLRSIPICRIFSTRERPVAVVFRDVNFSELKSDFIQFELPNAYRMNGSLAQVLFKRSPFKSVANFFGRASD